MKKLLISCLLIVISFSSCNSEPKNTGIMVEVSSKLFDAFTACQKDKAQLEKENKKLKEKIKLLDQELKKYKPKKGDKYHIPKELSDMVKGL